MICNWENIRGHTYSRTHETHPSQPSSPQQPHSCSCGNVAPQCAESVEQHVTTNALPVGHIVLALPPFDPKAYQPICLDT